MWQALPGPGSSSAVARVPETQVAVPAVRPKDASNKKGCPVARDCPTPGHNFPQTSFEDCTLRLRGPMEKGGTETDSLDVRLLASR